MTANVSSPRPALEALPAEVTATLFDCLLGRDIFHLSHVSRHFWTLLDAHAPVWTARCICHHHAEQTPTTTAWPPKRRLLSASSLQFRGRGTQAASSGDKGSCVDIRGLVLEWSELVAFDLWFALLPGDESTLAGGVLLGVQTTPFVDPRWPFYHQQFIVVDAQRNLLCSVISDKQQVATNLSTHRWYHLALMFDGHTQRVLLDGRLVSSVQGTIHHEAYSLRCMQLGTGCISAGSPGRPTPTFAGWYGFNGLVDEFRTWGMTLSNSAIAWLAKGEVIEERPRFSLHSNGVKTAKGGVVQVRCSRPKEQVCVLYDR